MEQWIKDLPDQLIHRVNLYRSEVLWVVFKHLVLSVTAGSHAVVFMAIG